MAYLLDANVFIQAKNLHYGFDFCPGFWDWIDTENQKGNIFSIEKIRDELLAGHDELTEWAKAKTTEFFLPPTPTILPSMGIMSSWDSTSLSKVRNFSEFSQYDALSVKCPSTTRSAYSSVRQMGCQIHLRSI